MPNINHVNTSTVTSLDKVASARQNAPVCKPQTVVLQTTCMYRETQELYAIKQMLLNSPINLTKSFHSIICFPS